MEEMKLAVMGCVVNGPGESKHANIGISLPGTFEEPKAPVYVDGRLFTTLKGDRSWPSLSRFSTNTLNRITRRVKRLWPTRVGAISRRVFRTAASRIERTLSG